VLRALAGNVKVDAFAVAMRALDPDALETLMNELQVGRLSQVLESTLQDVFQSIANSEIDSVVRGNPDPINPFAALSDYGLELPNGILMPREGNDLAFSIDDVVQAMFDYVDERSVRWAQTRSADLVTSINESNKLAIRQVISDAFTGPRTIDQTARTLRSIVGLHPRWARAVARNDDTVYANYIKGGMTPDQARESADRVTKTYRDRLIRRRAEMIARTEIQQAQNFGRQTAWEAGEKQGYVDPGSMKEWRTAPLGSRYGPPCDECQAVRGPAHRVPWNGTFSNGYMFPPAHPHCRCTVILVAPTRGLEGLPSQDMGSWLERLDQMYAEEESLLKHGDPSRPGYSVLNPSSNAAATAAMASMAPDKVENLVDLFTTLRSKGTVLVAAQPADAVAILKDGQFRTLFETGTSQGNTDIGKRESPEETMLGVPRGSKDRPVYGYVALDNLAPGGVADYGPIRFELKPDVKSRSTMTDGDSLLSAATPLPMTGGTISSSDAVAASLGNRSMKTLYGAFERRDLPVSDQFEAYSRSAYVEAQIKGKLSVSDIAKIHVAYPKPQWRSADFDAVEQAAAALGIPVIYPGGST
jgi:hypothetical protein